MGLIAGSKLRRVAKSAIERLGFRIVTKNSPLFSDLPHNVEAEFLPIYHKCRSYTMTGGACMYALYKAIEYIVRHKIPGDLVECGVYRGGSIMVCAEALARFGDRSRKLYLYDTFEGMSDPSERDVDFANRKPGDHLKMWGVKRVAEMARADVQQVRSNMRLTDYPEDQFVFVKGKVEDTLPGTIPDRLALLRLDTDWHASTHHELVHLFPRLSALGVLIVDDYGFWRGARDACDEYFAANGVKILLNCVGRAGEVIAVKPPDSA